MNSRVAAGNHSVSHVLPGVHPGVGTKVLSQVQIKREHFDASNKAHREAYFNFRKTGKWTVKFHNEFPYTDVVATINAKLFDHLETLDA